MKFKSLSALLIAFCCGISYQAGRISQRQKDDYSFNKVQIQQPSNKNNQKSDQLGVIQNDTFTDELIQSTIRRISYPNFKILYSTYHKCPLSVHERVTKSLADGDAPRRSTFFAEESIEPQFRVSHDHFRKSQAYKFFGFARGHMAAAGNFSGNKDAKFQTFSYANIVPQNQHNNAGIWNTFERYTRNLIYSDKCQSVEIISGPIFAKDSPYKQQTNGEILPNVYAEKSIVLLQNGIMVPEKLYKIIKCNKKNNEYYVSGFQFFNKKTHDNEKPLAHFQTPISKIEDQTGLKFNFQKIINKKYLNSQDIIEIKKGSLVQFDKQAFHRTKKHYDHKFYHELMKKSKDIDQLNNAFHRAKDQHIYIDLDDFKQQTNQYFNKDFSQINKNFLRNTETNSCQTLNRLMKLNKGLYYLKQINEEYVKKIEEAQNAGPLQKCLQKTSTLRKLKWQDIDQQVKQGVLSKPQKNSLNSITYAITKSSLSVSQPTRSPTAPFSYINNQKLNKFLISQVKVQSTPITQ